MDDGHNEGEAPDLSEPGAGDAQETMWKSVRSPQNPQHQQIVPYTAKWLVDLPADLRPVQLAAQFPRIANLLAVAWSVPLQRKGILEDLIWDRRGNRKGFPLEVHEELEALYASLAETQADSTDQSAGAPAV